jgi:membrane protein DedA with SNARE-associated domain
MILSSVFTGILSWYNAHLNYWTIAVLMAIESTFIPLPSELVLPPAAILASQGTLNLYLIILSASIGCVVGATINYVLSRTLGRVVIYALADSKLARVFFINRQKLQKAEDYFVENGNTSTFIGRLVPGIRHLISIPAGLAKMPFGKFAFYTFAGSLLWNTILSVLGYYIGENQDQLMRYFHEFKWIALGVGILFVAYLVFFKKRKGNK